MALTAKKNSSRGGNVRLVIDTQALVFLPIKHPDLFVCANLAWIECYPGQHYLITPMDKGFLTGLTDLERMILYKNTTGEIAKHYASKLVSVLLELAHRIPVREVNAAEVDIQAAFVPELRSERYIYNPGSKFPAIQPELFKLPPLKMAKASNENEIAAAPPQVAACAPIRLPATAPAPTHGAAPVGAAAAPRQANVAGVVWAVADQFWESAGKPTDTKVLLALRRKIMDELEQKHGTKRVTSSNELGRWMKTKV